MRFTILYGLLIQMVLFSHENGHSLRALIVFDTSTPDIQVASVADAARIKEALKFAAGQAKLTFRPTILNASNLTQRTFQKWLKGIHPKSGDVAFFYYAGRGSNRPHQKWPYIRLGAEKQISEKTITRRIASYKPDLAVVIFDCYNKLLTSQEGVDFSRVQKVDISRYGSMPGFRNLFRKYKGWMMWSSGQNVQNAYYLSQPQPVGGFFTSNFLKGFFRYSQEPKVGWGKIESCTRMSYFSAHINTPPPFDAHFTRLPSIGMR